MAVDALLHVAPKPEICYHFAGLFIKNFNERNLYNWHPFYSNNVLATRHVGMFAYQSRCSVVFTSSLIVSSSLHQDDYYVRSKKESEDELRKISGLQYKICRLPRVIGIYELPVKGNVLSDKSPFERIEYFRKQDILPFDIVSEFLMQAFNRDQRIRVHNAESQRSYIHLHDCVQGLISTNNLSAGTYELCPYTPIPLRRIGELIKEELENSNIPCKLEMIRNDEKDIVGPTNLPKIHIDKAFDSTENLIRNVCCEYMKLLGLL